MHEPQETLALDRLDGIIVIGVIVIGVIVIDAPGRSRSYSAHAWSHAPLKSAAVTTPCML